MKRLTFLLKIVRERVGLAPVALGTFVLGMFVLYVWQLSIATSAGYKMRAVEGEIADLRREIASQQAHIARLESIDSVSGRIQLLGLSKPADVAYIFTASDAVAVNR